MKPSLASKTLAAAFRHKLKILLKSAPGIGKSEIVAQAARLAEADLVVMHPAVSDPTDFKGMPAIVPPAHGRGALAEFLPFGQLRKLVEATGLTVCFIDDIGQAPHSVQAALMQLIQAREVDGTKISPHVVFAGATNDASHMAGVASILEPVKSRWDSIIELEFSLEDWLDWCLSTGWIPPEIIAFARFRPALINDFKATRELTNSPCPRTVVSVAKWVHAGITSMEVLAGAAGEGFAAEFSAFLKIWRSMIDLDSVIAAPTVAPVPPRHDASLTIATATALSFRADKSNFGAILTYLARLPKEYEVFAVNDAWKRDPSLASTKHFTAWALANNAVLSA